MSDLSIRTITIDKSDTPPHHNTMPEPGGRGFSGFEVCKKAGLAASGIV